MGTLPTVGLLWLVVLVAVPVLELWVFVQVSNAIGFGWALLAAIGVSLGGAWLVKHQGLAVGRRFQERLARGEAPDKEVADGAILLVAGLLLLFPGFVTGALGLLLLLPPVRALLRPRLRSRRRVIVATYGTRVVDTTATDASAPPRAELPADVGGDQP